MRFFSQLNWHPDSSIHNLGDPPQVLLRRAAEVDGGDVRHGIALGLSHEEEVQGDALVSQRLDVHDGAEEVLAEAVVQQDLPLGTAERVSSINTCWSQLIKIDFNLPRL